MAALAGDVYAGPIARLAIVLLLVAIQAAALLWRRSRPILVLAVVVAAQALTILIGSPHEGSGVAVAFAIYAVSVYDHSRWRLAVVAVAMALILLAVGLLILGDVQTARIYIPVGAVSLVAWVVGDYIRSRRTFLADLVARNRQDREQAAEEERLRIARELHDVVAHNVSVMAIQAGAARVSGNSSHEALASIESTARDTLSELNRLVGILRHGPAAPELSPQPGLAQLETVLKPLRDAGIDVSLKITGEVRELPAAVDLSAFRIVQEAVTNVMKHAHASRVEVTVDYAADAVAIVVGDNGSGATSPVAASTGHGLIGMHERVDLFGGELWTGSSSLGGFTVRARLPLR